MLLVLAAPIGEDTQTFYNFKNFADFSNVCSANILVLTGLQHPYILSQYKENQNVCSITPIWLNIAYSVSWSKRKWKYNYSKMVAKLKTKIISIPIMGAVPRAQKKKTNALQVPPPR